MGSSTLGPPWGSHHTLLTWQGEEEDVEQHSGTADGDTPLSARLRVTAHWLLWAAGKGLAVLLLALAGAYGMGGACGELGVSWWPGCWKGCSVQGEMMLSPGGDARSR